MAEQWLYAPASHLKEKQHLKSLTRHRRGHGTALAKSVNLDDVRHRHSSIDDFSDSDDMDGGHMYLQRKRQTGEIDGKERRTNRNRRDAGISSDDDFLVTASDPELSSLRFSAVDGQDAPISPPGGLASASGATRGRRRASISDLPVGNRDEGELELDALDGSDAVVEVVKPSRHRLSQRNSLNKVS